MMLIHLLYMLHCTTAITWWPARWQCNRAIMVNKFPMCKLSAVGSNPQYTPTTPLVKD